MQRRSFSLSFLAGAGILAAGCGGGGEGNGEHPLGPAPSPGPGPGPVPAPVAVAHAYIAMPTSAEVAIYGVLANGALDEIGNVSAEAGTEWVAVHASGRFAYAVNVQARTITIYERDRTTGMLLLTGSPVAIPQFSTDLRFDPSGLTAFVKGGGGVGLYSVDLETGALHLEQFTAANSHRFGLHPSLPNVFVMSDLGSLTSYRVDGYALDEVNTVMPSESAIPAGLAVAPSGEFLYAAFFIRGIAIHRIRDTGAIEPETMVDLEFGGGPLAIHPSGRFAYVAGFGGDEDTQGIFVFEIEGGTGMLNRRAFHVTNTGVVSLTVSPDGRFLFTANHDSTTVSAFIIQESGELLGASSPIDVGSQPASICLVGIDG